MKMLEEIYKKLPPELQREVEEFALFLLEKKAKGRKEERFLKQDWAGGLKRYRKTYTSLDLERKALEWRGD